MIRWIIEMVEGQASAVETPLGFLPEQGSLDLSGLSIPAADLRELLRVNTSAWTQELELIRAHFEAYGERLPTELWAEVNKLERELPDYG